MLSVAEAKSTPLMLWTGRGLSGLAVLFLLFDSIIKLIKIDPVTQSMVELGYPDSLARGIGAMELICVALYVYPRTAVLGAVLLTGLFGGAISSHVRIGDPLFSHVLFGVYLGLFVWGGLFLRDGRLRSLFPVRL
ncbi:MAG: Arginine/ornithine antiporter ArcD [Hyphomicrobiales bacterium]|nr:Arginine/ornithine antiporter ArcD [Hyphomicrobiales bacterium]